MNESVRQAAAAIKSAKHVTAFTGAGISVESGIPTFRGAEGLWSKYNPVCLDIGYFHSNARESWEVVKEIFYDFFGEAQPNEAHLGLAAMEREGFVKAVITQNIDNLHQEAGSRNVLEFHGTSRRLVCLRCGTSQNADKRILTSLPPLCNCGSVLKPDFVFFGEQIPEAVSSLSFGQAELADVFLLIGTTGEVMPASLIPAQARQNGAVIIEINPESSNYTHRLTNIFLRGKATSVMSALLTELGMNPELSSDDEADR